MVLFQLQQYILRYDFDAKKHLPPPRQKYFFSHLFTVNHCKREHIVDYLFIIGKNPKINNIFCFETLQTLSVAMHVTNLKLYFKN